SSAAGGLSECQVGAIGAGSRQAHRRDAKRMSVPVPEERYMLAAPRDIAKHAWKKSVVFEICPISAQRCVRFRSFGDERIKHERQAAPGCPFKIIKAEIGSPRLSGPKCGPRQFP